MKIKIVFFLLLFCSVNSFAQTVVLNIDPNEQQRKSRFGPNLDRFAHFNFRFGMVASEDKPGAEIIYGGSINFSIGVRAKYKISSVYSMGYDIDLSYIDYKFKQEKGKVFPDTILYNTAQRLDYSSIMIGYYNRFNFDPGRGNSLGRFLDIGINASYDYSINTISKSEFNEIHYKLVESHLPFVNKINSNIFFRFGRNHFTLYSLYRITNLFKPSYAYPEMPRLILGIEVAIF